MLLTIIILLVLCLQYGGCVALYHASERRSMVELLVRSARARATLKVVGWCLLIASVFLCASLQGWERGIPIWFCLIAVTGFVSLYISAYKALHHVKSGLAALAVSALLGSATLLIGDSVKTSKEIAQHETANAAI